MSEIKSKLNKISQDKADAEVKNQKDEQFEIRKNRFAEIDVELNIENMFYFLDGFYVSSKELVYNASITEFEQILIDCKKSIADFKEQKEIFEKERLEAEANAEKQKAIDLELAKKDTERLKKENAQRVNRLANDKKQLLKTINSITYTYNYFTLENKESQDFLEIILNRISKLESELLTELENL